MNSDPKPIGAGKSSFDLIDVDIFASALALEPGDTVLDAACGPGRYTLFLAGRKIPELQVVAVDLWEDGIRGLREEISNGGLEGVRAEVADISRFIPDGFETETVLEAGPVLYLSLFRFHGLP